MPHGEQEPPYLLVALKLRCTAASLPWWRWWLRRRMRHDADIIAEHAHAIGQRIDWTTGHVHDRPERKGVMDDGSQ
jgi:hypothetical protein